MSVEKKEKKKQRESPVKKHHIDFFEQTLIPTLREFYYKKWDPRKPRKFRKELEECAEKFHQVFFRKGVKNGRFTKGVFIIKKLFKMHINIKTDPKLFAAAISWLMNHGNRIITKNPNHHRWIAFEVLFERYFKKLKFPNEQQSLNIMKRHRIILYYLKKFGIMNNVVKFCLKPTMYHKGIGDCYWESHYGYSLELVSRCVEHEIEIDGVYPVLETIANILLYGRRSEVKFPSCGTRNCYHEQVRTTCGSIIGKFLGQVTTLEIPAKLDKKWTLDFSNNLLHIITLKISTRSMKNEDSVVLENYATILKGLCFSDLEENAHFEMSFRILKLLWKWNKFDTLEDLQCFFTLIELFCESTGFNDDYVRLFSKINPNHLMMFLPCFFLDTQEDELKHSLFWFVENNLRELGRGSFFYNVFFEDEEGQEATAPEIVMYPAGCSYRMKSKYVKLTKEFAESRKEGMLKYLDFENVDEIELLDEDQLDECEKRIDYLQKTYDVIRRERCLICKKLEGEDGCELLCCERCCNCVYCCEKCQRNDFEDHKKMCRWQEKIRKNTVMSCQ